MQLYEDNVQDLYGNARPGVSVLVEYEGSPATIYSDNGVTPKANPLTTGAGGSFSFYAANGVYTLTAGEISETVTLFDSTELATAGGAALIGNAPAGSIAAETVQDAINELDTEKTAAADLAASGGSALVGFVADGTGAVLRTLQAKQRDIVSVDDFGAIGDGDTHPLSERYASLAAAQEDYPHAAALTDEIDWCALMAGIEALYLAKGGDLHAPDLYVVHAPVVVPQRVTLVGSNPGFANQYVTDHAAPKKSAIFVRAGSNCDALVFRCRLTNNAGTLEETTLGGRNVDARHFGGARSLCVWGNRSANQSPEVADLNTAGRGIVVQGSRYVTLENVTAMFCAEDGVFAESYDYGTGSIPTNNLMWCGVSSHSNAGNGFNLTAADCSLTQLQAGFNAVNGGLFALANSIVSASYSWNNWLNGFLWQGGGIVGSSSMSGCRAYDNSSNGFKIDTAGQVNLIGCQTLNNGRTTNGAPTPADAERSNFHVTSSAQGAILSGCQSISSGTYSQYGFYIDNSVYTAMVDNCRASGAVLENYHVADMTKLMVHYESGSTLTPKHPGFVSSGDIDMGGNAMAGVGTFRFKQWSTITSITSNTIPVTTNSLLVLNCTGAQTVNDISWSGVGVPMVILRNVSADAVTFVHNAGKLRCANAANVVLAINESVTFLWVSGTAWQQIGAAA
jgi:hypothetical protein